MEILQKKPLFDNQKLEQLQKNIFVFLARAKFVIKIKIGCNKHTVGRCSYFMGVNRENNLFDHNKYFHFIKQFINMFEKYFNNIVNFKNLEILKEKKKPV